MLDDYPAFFSLAMVGGLGCLLLWASHIIAGLRSRVDDLEADAVDLIESRNLFIDDVSRLEGEVELLEAGHEIELDINLGDDDD